MSSRKVDKTKSKLKSKLSHSQINASEETGSITSSSLMLGSEDTGSVLSHSQSHGSDETQSIDSRSIRYGSDETKSIDSNSVRYGSDETKSINSRSVKYGSDETKSTDSRSHRYGSDETKSIDSLSVRYGFDETKSIDSRSVRYGSDETKSIDSRSVSYGSDETNSIDSRLHRYGSDETKSIDSLWVSYGSDKTKMKYAVGTNERQNKGTHTLSSVFEMCDVHEGKLLDFYCADHNVSGCSMCMKLTHGSCKNVQPRSAQDVIGGKSADIAIKGGDEVGATTHDKTTKAGYKVEGKSADKDTKGDDEVGGKSANIASKGGDKVGGKSADKPTKGDDEVGWKSANSASKGGDEVGGQLKIQSNDDEVAGARSKPRRLYSVTGSRYINVMIEGDKEACDIKDICQLPDGRLLMTDWRNNKLKLLDQSYTVIDHCDMSCFSGLLCWCDEEICVGQSSSLLFVSIQDKMAISRTMKLKHDCMGLVYRDGELYVSDCRANIHVYNKAGNQLRIYNIYSVVGKGWKHEYLTVSMDGRQLYMTHDQYLICIDRQSGEVIWRVKGDNGSLYIGVCVDKDNNVMVCNTGRGEIVQYSSDGVKLRAIVNSLKYTCSICFDQDNKILLVGQWKSNWIKIFDLK